MPVILLVALALSPVCHAAEGAHPETLLRNARVVDARGEVGQRDILLRDGYIAAVEEHWVADTAGVEIVDLAGATVVPGLIDTHVHISMAPGAAWRGEPEEGIDARRGRHLRAYLAWGVTTILDPAITEEQARRIRHQIDGGTPGPEVLWLGPTVSPAGGYVARVIPEFPSVASPDEVGPLLDTFADLAPVGVKVTMERGVLNPIWPIHSPAVRRAIVDEAATRGLDLYVHAMTWPMVRLGLELGPRAIVHGPSKPLGAKRAARVAQAGTYIGASVAITMASMLEWQPERLADPWMVQTVPADELATASDPKVQADYKRAMIDVLAPKLPGFLRKTALRIASRRKSIQRRVDHAQAAIAELHAAGVPIVAGSDSGNWPILPFLFHGPSTHLELEGLHAAGLTNLEVLTAATKTPAEMLRRGDELGTIEVDKVANLLVLDGDPLVDLGALRQPRYTVRAGIVRTPSQWLAAADAPRGDALDAFVDAIGAVTACLDCPQDDGRGPLTEGNYEAAAPVLADIRAWARAGLTEDEILDGLEAMHGPAILLEPRERR